MDIWDEDKELELLEAWKACPLLFEVGTRTYHDRNKREKMYKSIADEIKSTGKLFHDFLKKETYIQIMRTTHFNQKKYCNAYLTKTT